MTAAARAAGTESALREDDSDPVTVLVGLGDAIASGAPFRVGKQALPWALVVGGPARRSELSSKQLREPDEVAARGNLAASA